HQQDAGDAEGRQRGLEDRLTRRYTIRPHIRKAFTAQTQSTQRFAEEFNVFSAVLCVLCSSAVRNSNFMDFSIASILALDGATNGAVYALPALALVLVFAITRVIFIPRGEFVAFGALTLAMLQLGKLRGTVWLLLALAGLAGVLDLLRGLRAHRSPA